jgi:hypothetical protein
VPVSCILERKIIGTMIKLKAKSLNGAVLRNVSPASADLVAASPRLRLSITMYICIYDRNIYCIYCNAPVLYLNRFSKGSKK